MATPNQDKPYQTTAESYMYTQSKKWVSQYNMKKVKQYPIYFATQVHTESNNMTYKS